MSKHTPGPWSVFRTPSGYKNLRGPNNHRVSGDICGLDSSDEENDANIDLMAAAPEMLAILEQLDLCRGPHDMTDAAVAIRIVIAKAKGEL